ncbi:Ovarian tumor, otubain [Corchorus capsularis]|uniref:ubiquitinyl hydrolase 1 n=1 Tax=Corchorus capsularis TaxID=210143 RepID=A0A1R3J7D2_COCAP|nr:Ovarian tumor, otubain [Corchorus capsularis]
MLTCDIDPDVLRWGLQDLQVCVFTHSGTSGSLIQYERDNSQTGHVGEGYCEAERVNVENDAVIARILQEELSRVAAAESSGYSNPGQDSIIAQDWFGFPTRQHIYGCGTSQVTVWLNDSIDLLLMLYRFQSCIGHDADRKVSEDPNQTERSTNEVNDGKELMSRYEKGGDCGMGDKVVAHEDMLRVDIIDESSVLDGEVEKRLNDMVAIPHVPKINGEIPSVDEEVSDHQRLLDRLQLYGLVENKVQGDGNCQFRSLSDQLYRSQEHHRVVRELVVSQLKSYPGMYEGYVPMGYADYLKKMNKNGEWGDHVTLQAAADSYGVRIFVLTSFKDTCYIEILPHIQKSERIIFLSFWAEVHYNSIYPEGANFRKCYFTFRSTCVRETVQPRRSLPTGAVSPWTGRSSGAAPPWLSLPSGAATGKKEGAAMFSSLDILQLRAKLDGETDEAVNITELARDKDRNLILAFDVSEEVFREIPLPECLSNVKPMSFIRLPKYGQSIAAMTSEHSDSIQEVKQTLWVMKEYGVAMSWTRVFMEVAERVPRVLFLRQYEEQMFVVWEEGSIVSLEERWIASFDIKNKHSENSGVKSVDHILAYPTIDGFVESLVLLDNNNACWEDPQKDASSYEGAPGCNICC